MCEQDYDVAKAQSIPHRDGAAKRHAKQVVSRKLDCLVSQHRKGMD